MYGMARVAANVSCSIVFLVNAAILGAVALVHVFSRSHRVVVVIPVFALVPTYALYHRAIDQVEQVPALRENFALSEVELDGLADKILAGEESSLPQQVGRFVIVRYERLSDGVVALYTKENPEHREMWGFIRCPDQIADSGPARLVGVPNKAGEDHLVERLKGDWFVLFHHYWFIKRGWS